MCKITFEFEMRAVIKSDNSKNKIVKNNKFILFMLVIYLYLFLKYNIFSLFILIIYLFLFLKNNINFRLTRVKNIIVKIK